MPKVETPSLINTHASFPSSLPLYLSTSRLSTSIPSSLSLSGVSIGPRLLIFGGWDGTRHLNTAEWFNATNPTFSVNPDTSHTQPRPGPRIPNPHPLHKSSTLPPHRPTPLRTADAPA
jgi:hypothetical protein